MLLLRSSYLPPSAASQTMGPHQRAKSLAGSEAALTLAPSVAGAARVAGAATALVGRAVVSAILLLDGPHAA